MNAVVKILTFQAVLVLCLPARAVDRCTLPERIPQSTLPCMCGVTGVCVCGPGNCGCGDAEGVGYVDELPAPQVDPPADRQRDPGPAPSPLPPNPGQPQQATVVVENCVGCVVTFDGWYSYQFGDVRTWHTPPIGDVSHYTVTATWIDKTITGAVTVWPGQTTVVKLDWDKQSMAFEKNAKKYANPAGGDSGYYMTICNGGTCERVFVRDARVGFVSGVGGPGGGCATCPVGGCATCPGGSCGGAAAYGGCASCGGGYGAGADAGCASCGGGCGGSGVGRPARRILWRVVHPFGGRRTGGRRGGCASCGG